MAGLYLFVMNCVWKKLTLVSVVAVVTKVILSIPWVENEIVAVFVVVLDERDENDCQFVLDLKQSVQLELELELELVLMFVVVYYVPIYY